MNPKQITKKYAGTPYSLYGVLILSTLAHSLILGIFLIARPSPTDMDLVSILGVGLILFSLLLTTYLFRTLLAIKIQCQKSTQTLSHLLDNNLDRLFPLPKQKMALKYPPLEELELCLNEILLSAKSDLTQTKQTLKDALTLNALLLNQATDRHKHLELSTLALGALNLGLRVVNESQEILYENPQFYKLTHHAPDRFEHLIRIALNHISEDLSENKYIENMDTHVTQVQLMPISRGTTPWLTTSCTLIIIEDISKQEALKTQLLDTEKLSAIGMMSAQISHEIRNPLNALSLNLDMLQEDLKPLDTLPQSVQPLLTGIVKQAHRLKTLSDHYLNLFKLFEDKKIFNPKRVIQDVVFAFRPLAHQRKCTLTCHIDHAPCMIYGDPQALSTIVQNLLLNALEAESPEIVVRCGLDASGNFKLKIKDSGPGISSQAQEKIFTLFYTTKNSGTGLGLSVAKYASEHLDGTLTFHCGLSSRGTLFTFCCPIEQKTHDTPNPTQQHTHSATL